MPKELPIFETLNHFEVEAEANAPIFKQVTLSTELQDNIGAEAIHQIVDKIVSKYPNDYVGFTVYVKSSGIWRVDGYVYRGGGYGACIGFGYNQTNQNFYCRLSNGTWQDGKINISS